VKSNFKLKREKHNEQQQKTKKRSTQHCVVAPNKEEKYMMCNNCQTRKEKDCGEHQLKLKRKKPDLKIKKDKEGKEQGELQI
jgi:hypothetical protein